MKAALERAVAAIESEDWPLALRELLAVWRGKRVARIAALVDRVSDRIPAVPVAGKTVNERLAAWLGAAEAVDPAALGGLLATPWPGKWQDNRRVLEALDRFPEDPRIAIAVARRVVGRPYDNKPSLAFYRAALALIAKANDVRTKPILEADLAREKPLPWTELFRQTIAGLAAPELTAKDDAAIAAVEALFARDIQREATNEKSEADFLEAIYADPDDDALRAVFADWLTERGDPRGEFIALQLQPNRSPAARKREAALLKKHAAAWAGRLEPALQVPRFRRGFVSGGILDEAATSEDLALPEWALIESLDIMRIRDPGLPAVVDAGILRNVRSLCGAREAFVARVAREGLAPQLEDVWMVVDGDVDLDRRREIARGFSRLKSLGLGEDVDALVAYVAGPMPAGLERLVVLGPQSPLDPVARAVEAAKLDLPVIEARAYHGWNEASWRLELRRDDEGRFSRLRAGPGNPDLPLPPAREFAQALSGLADLTEVVVPPAGGCDWASGPLAAVEAELAAQKSLVTIEVPWDRDVGRSPKDAPHIKLSIAVRAGIATEVDAILRTLTSPPISLGFDSLAKNGEGHTPLKSDGASETRALLAKKQTHWVEVYCKRSANTMRVDFRSTSAQVTLPWTRDFDVDAWLAWMGAFLDRTNIDTITAPFRHRHYDVLRDTKGKPLGPMAEEHKWIMCLPETHYPLDELAASARGIEGVRAFRAKRHLLVALGDAQVANPNDATRDAFEALLGEAFWRHFARSHGFVPGQLAARILGPALLERGFVEDSTASWSRRGTRVGVELDMTASPLVRLQVRLHDEKARTRALPIVRGVVSPGEAATALEAFVGGLDGALEWLEAE